MSPIVQPSSMPQTTKVTFSEDAKKDSKKIKSYNRNIKLANYDGTGEWRDYKSHFDACAAINDWEKKRKGYTWQLRCEAMHNAYLETYHQTARYTILA